MVAKVFWGSPGDFGAMGQDSIVGQSFILLNAKSVFFGMAARSICGTNVYLANYAKHIISAKKTYVFGLDVSVVCGLAVRLASGT